MTKNIFEYITYDAIKNLNLFLQKNKHKEIVFFCAGNFKIWYDSFSSAFAKSLKEQKKKVFVYGGEGFSILPDNLFDFMNFVETNHSTAKIIVVDNCKTISATESGILVARETTIVPAGLTNEKPFGHYTLLLKVNINDNANSFLKKQKFIINEIVKNIAI